jgi:hypothetical protein
MKAEYGLIAVPHWWVKDWLLNLLVFAFGHEIPAHWPFEHILYREITVREQEQIARDSSV